MKPALRKTATVFGASALSLLLGACDAPASRTEPDQCLRRELFAECMKLVPKGPTTTHYNDWAEVVEQCASTAYYQSMRQNQSIKLECRT